MHSTSQLFFRCTQLFRDKSKIKLWNLRKAKIFQAKHYFDNRLSQFGDLGFNYLQKYDRINSQKIRIQDSQSKKEPENSVFSDFESKYSTFTQLFF